MEHGRLTHALLKDQTFVNAYKKVAAKGSAGGIDGECIRSFGDNLARNIKLLIRDIREHRYIPQPAAVIHIPKFDKNGSWRELGLPTVSDKVIQNALLSVIEPLAEKLFLDTSYGYRPEKGPQKALRRIEHNLRCSKCCWTAKMDIDNFFDTLDHDLLLSRFSSLVDGEDTLIELVALWCKIGLVDKTGRWRNVMAGVRQGHVISPLLANLYLHPFDQFMRERAVESVRYADDILLQTRTREGAKQAYRDAKNFLAENLKLRINDDVAPIACLEEGFVFLGVNLQGAHRKIDPEKVAKMKRKVAFLLSPKSRVSPEDVLKKLIEATNGWLHYYGFLNPVDDFRNIDAELRRKFVEFLRRWNCACPGRKALSPDLWLPSLETGNDQVKGRRLLQVCWKDVLDQETYAKLDPIKTSTTKKITKQHKIYDRREATKGELIVTTPGLFVAKRGERVLVREKQQIVAEITALHLRALTLGSRGIGLSGDVVRLCTDRDIPVNFVNETGKIYATLVQPGAFRRAEVVSQIADQDGPKGLWLAKMFVSGKVKNQFSLLKYFGKYRNGNEGSKGFKHLLKEKDAYLSELVANVSSCSTGGSAAEYRQKLMGLEGAFAAVYWLLVRALLPEKSGFPGRVREGARDRVNNALNYGYGILYSHVLNSIVRARLNPGFGFLHSDQNGKPTLAFDLVEEFRAPTVDRSVFAMINRGETIATGSDGFLDTDSRKRVARSVIDRLSRHVCFRGESFPLGHIIDMQARNISAFLRGEGKYRPFLAKW